MPSHHRAFEYQILDNGLYDRRSMNRVMTPEVAAEFLWNLRSKGRPNASLRCVNFHWEVERAHVEGDWPKTWTMVTDKTF